MTTETGALVGWEEERRSLLECPALAWARLTGRRVDLRDAPWLRGVAGASRVIGEEYFVRLARQEQLCDPATGAVRTTAWLRRLNHTGDVLFAGIYSTAQPPNAAGPCVKAVYPLPNGNATVFFTPIAGADGSLELRSEGRRFGDPGFYFTVRRDEDAVWAKYVRAMSEWLHIYVDEREELRAEHVFRTCGTWILKLHYAIYRT